MSRLKSLVLLLVTLIYSTLNAIDPAAPQQPTTEFSSDLNASLLIEGCVDIATLSSVLRDELMSVSGPDPLAISRTSAGNNSHKSSVGFGFGIDVPGRIFKFRREGDQFYASWTPREGAREALAGKKIGDVIVLKPTKASFAYGRNNLSGGGPSARTDGSNIEFRYLDYDSLYQNGRFEVLLGDGTRRYYIRYGKAADKQFIIERERLPSGNWRHYDFDSQQRLQMVATHAESGTILNFVRITYSDDQVTLVSSDDQTTSILLRKQRVEGLVNDLWDDKDVHGRKNLTHAFQIQGNSQPTKTYGIGSTRWLRGQLKTGQLALPGGWERNFGYKEQGGYVSGISVGANQPGKSIKKWTFEAWNDKRQGSLKRSVRGPFGGSSIYSYDTDTFLLKSIDHNETCEKYQWDKEDKHKPARLRRWELFDKSRKLLKAIDLVYDSRGNVIKETLSGCLTEEDSFDVVTREYCYSDDGFNLMLSSAESDGRITRFAYKPGTNLLTEKGVEDKGRTLHRDFYQYDEYANLIKHIEDDGSAKEQSDLREVTCRRVTRCIPRLSLAGFGKSDEVRESYVDLATGQELQLMRTTFEYDQRGLCTQKTFYDSSNALIGSEGFTFGDERLCIRHAELLGSVTDYTYNERRSLASEHHLDSGRKKYYSYDSQNRLCETRSVYTDAAEVIHRTSWHLGDQPLVETDRYGVNTTYEYDRLGRRVKTQTPLATHMCEYNALGHVSACVDAGGYRTETITNVRGQPLRVIHPDSTEERFRYDLRGQCLEHHQRDGTLVSYKYDAMGNCILMRRENGSLTEFTVREFKSTRCLSETALGLTTRHEYDASGRLVASTTLNRRTTYAFDTQGRIQQTRRWIDDDTYIAACVEYDILGRAVDERTVHSDGSLLSHTSREYDLLGNIAKERRYSSEKSYAETEYVFNTAGEPLSEINPLGIANHREISHRNLSDDLDWVRQETLVDPLGRKVISKIDLAGRVSELVRLSADARVLSVSRHRFDERGLKKSEEHEVYGQAGFERTYHVTFEYDVFGNCTAIHEPDRSTSFSFDAAGRLDCTTKPDGTRLIRIYNGLGDLVAIRSSDGTIDHAFEYDKRHNCIKGVDKVSGHIVNRAFNALGELIKEERDGLDQYYRYDTLGQRQSFRLPLNLGSITYKRESGRLVSISRTGTQNYTHRYREYDLLGRPLTQDLVGKAGAQDTCYDEIGRVKSIASRHWQLNVPEHGYNALGMLEQQQIDDPIGRYVFDAKYDDRGQLAAESGEFTHEYQHDSLENRCGVDEIKYEIGSHNQLLAVGSEIVRNDANGSPIQIEADEYTYDALGRLTKHTNSTLRVSYSYDVFGRRIEKRTERLAITGWVPEDRERYLWDGDREIGSVEDQKRIRTLRVLGLGYGIEIGASVALEIAGTVYVPIHDPSGNICSLVDAFSGEAAATYRYSAFGEYRCLSGDEIANPWRFSSKREDHDTNLVYFGQRYYVPRLGRWLTPDPLGLADGLNTYCYAHNKPVTLIDPTGLFSEDRDGVGFWNSIYNSPLVQFRIGLDEGVIQAGKDVVGGVVDASIGIYNAASFTVQNPAEAWRRTVEIAGNGCTMARSAVDATSSYVRGNGFGVVSALQRDRNRLTMHCLMETGRLGNQLFESAMQLNSREWGNLTGRVGGHVLMGRGVTCAASVFRTEQLVSAALATERTSFAIEEAGFARSYLKFSNDYDLLEHFAKHGRKFAVGSAEEYLDLANNVVRNGLKVQYEYDSRLTTGFVKFMGHTAQREAEFAFVGLNPQGAIATFHPKRARDLYRTINGDYYNNVINAL